MPSPQSRGYSIPFASFRRPIMTLRVDQVHSESNHGLDNPKLESFQSQVFNMFNDLSSANDDEFLSISWIQKLLDALVSCLEDFTAVLCDNKPLLSKPTADKLASEYFDRALKAMDIFNAARDGIETVRLWQKHLEIIVCALDTRKRIVSEGGLRRARKALMDMSLAMVDDKDNGSIFSHRNRSFGRNKGKEQQRGSSGHSRSLSWSVSHTWSASKQLHSIANNLIPPRSNEIAATSGLASLVFTMSFILMFVLWILVAVVPCQDRGVQTPFTIPRQFSWSVPLVLIQSRVVDESKKRERRNSNGLLREIYLIEKSVHLMTDLIDAAPVPINDEVKEQILKNVEELSAVCETCKTGLTPLQCKLREVFRKVVSCRSEGLDFIARPAEA